MNVSNEQPEHLRGLSRKPRKKAHAPPGYDPLGTCPPSKRWKYEKTAKFAATGSLAAILRLKCLECVAWQQSEVQRCEIRGCALWPRARRDLCLDAESVE